MRFTPAGISVITCVLQHIGMHDEAESERQIDLVLNAVAMGCCSERLSQMSLGSSAWFTGFLALKHRNSKILEFHITDFQVLPKVDFLEKEEKNYGLR